MSLYNQLFGVNPITPLLLKIVGVTLSEIPRFRDCHIDVDERGSASIVIYTRTGGGNDECNCDGNDCSGECYRAMNRDLQYKKNCLDFQCFTGATSAAVI